MVLLAIVSSEDVEFIVIKCGCMVLDLRCLEYDAIWITIIDLKIFIAVLVWNGVQEASYSSSLSATLQTVFFAFAYKDPFELLGQLLAGGQNREIIWWIVAVTLVWLRLVLILWVGIFDRSDLVRYCLLDAFCILLRIILFPILHAMTQDLHLFIVDWLRSEHWIWAFTPILDLLMRCMHCPPLVLTCLSASNALMPSDMCITKISCIIIFIEFIRLTIVVVMLIS